MKKGTKTIIIVVAIVAVIAMMLGSTYNGMVTKSEEVDSKFADISVQLERRLDLIPNLVNTVKGYAKHEEKIIDDVTSARENLLSAKTTGEKAEANQQLTEATNKMLMLVEKYPDLKANEQFTQLQDELAGTENRIAVVRKEYNEVVKDYNKSIKTFPKNIIAGMFGFEEKEYFQAKDSANEAPDVSFD